MMPKAMRIKVFMLGSGAESKSWRESPGDKES
jgi:hypothetical protein